MKHLGSKAAAIVVSAAGIALLGGSAAYAFWSTTGTGTGTATSTASSPLTLTMPASVAGLYPTGTVTATVSVRNDNPFAVGIASMSFGVTTAEKSAQSPEGTCTASTVTFAVAAGAPASIPLNGSVDVPIAVTMSNLAPDACQNATFTSTLTVNGQSA